MAYKDDFIVRNDSNQWQGVKESFFADKDLNWRKTVVRLVEKEGRWRFVESDNLQDPNDTFQLSEINMLRFAPGGVVELRGQGFIPYQPYNGSFEFLNNGATIFAYFGPGDNRNGFTIYDGTQEGENYKYSGSFFGMEDRYTDVLESFRELEVWDIATDQIMDPSGQGIKSQFVNYEDVTCARKDGGEMLTHSTLCTDGCTGSGYFGGSANGGLSRSDIFGPKNYNKKFTLSFQFYLPSDVSDDFPLWSFTSPELDQIQVHALANGKLRYTYRSPIRDIEEIFVSTETFNLGAWNHVLMGKKVSPTNINIPVDGPNDSTLSFYINGVFSDDFTIPDLAMIQMFGNTTELPNQVRNSQAIATEIALVPFNDNTVTQGDPEYGFNPTESTEAYQKTTGWGIQKVKDATSSSATPWDFNNYNPQDKVATGAGFVEANTGKYMFRVSAKQLAGTGSEQMTVGVVSASIPFPTLEQMQGITSDGQFRDNSFLSGVINSGFSQGDTIEVMLDTDNGRVHYWVNETFIGDVILKEGFPVRPAVHIGKLLDEAEVFVEKSHWAPFLSTIDTTTFQGFPKRSRIEPRPVAKAYDFYVCKYLVNLGNGPNEVDIDRITDIAAPEIQLTEVGNPGNVLTIPQKNYVKKRNDRLDFKVPEDFPHGYYNMKLTTRSVSSFTIPFRVEPDEVQTTAFVEDFSDIESVRKNYTVYHRQWGGENRGVVKENVRYDQVNQELIIAAHGDQYTGPIRGVDRFGNRLTDAYISENDIRDFDCNKPFEDRAPMTNPYFRKGGGIVFNKRTGYGKYRVRAKFPDQTGCVYAFWTFFYNEIYEADDKWDFYTSSNREPRFNALAYFNFHRTDVPDFFFSRFTEAKFEVLNPAQWVMRGGIGEATYLDFHYTQMNGGEKYPWVASRDAEVMKFGFLEYYPQKGDAWSFSLGFKHEPSQLYDGSQDGKRNSLIKYGEGGNWFGIDVEYNAAGQATLEFVYKTLSAQTTQTIATLNQDEWIWLGVSANATEIKIYKWDTAEAINLGSPGVDTANVFTLTYPSGDFNVAIPTEQTGTTSYTGENPNIPASFTYRESRWHALSQSPILGTAYTGWRKIGIDKLVISNETLSESTYDHLFRYRGKFSNFNDNPNCGIQGTEGRYAVRNHEIDIEIPSHLKTEGMTDQNIKLNNMKTMTWRSEIGRYSNHAKQFDTRGNFRDETGVVGPDPVVESQEKNYHSNYMPMFPDGSSPADQWHEWGFDWHPDRIEYYVDGVLRHTNYDSEMGRVIPSISGRFVMGIWFPRFGWWNGSNCLTNYWAGSQANFSEIEMRVSDWSFEPFNQYPQAGNQGETYPYTGYAPFQE